MKGGLEIHRRLDTHKLFCSCPSELAEGKNPDVKIERRLHPVLSELGEIDVAARMEHGKEKSFGYNAFDANNCLVETDEEPPHELNRDALAIAMEIAENLNSKPVDEVHVMRKIVIDGSNTSGFQRTAVISLGGHVETSRGRVGITQIALEEESAGIIGTNDNMANYSLDRLCIPLVEISTDPDIKDGAHLAEAAEKIGMILRATGKVARGLGTIRQDVNVSTEGGARVEIKGAQDLKMLQLLWDNEVKRQQELLKIINEIKKRFGGNVTLKSEIKDITVIFSNTTSNMIKGALQKGNLVFAAKLANHAGLLGKEIQPNRRYGSELSDYAKLAGVKGIIHSDEDFGKYGLDGGIKKKVAETLGCGQQDAFVIIFAEEKQAKKAFEKVFERVGMFFVPKETRKANPDGSTSFMRPLAGSARMYPETDVPPFALTKDFLKAVKSGMGESLEDKKAKLAELLNQEMAEKMLKSRHLALFEKLVAAGNDAMLVATTLENTIVSLRREGVEIKDTDSALTSLFLEYKKGIFVKGAIPEILKGMAGGKSISGVVEEKQLKRIAGTELKKIAEENNFDIGKIMQKYRLRVDPKDVEMLKKKS